MQHLSDDSIIGQCAQSVLTQIPPEICLTFYNVNITNIPLRNLFDTKVNACRQDTVLQFSPTRERVGVLIICVYRIWARSHTYLEARHWREPNVSRPFSHCLSVPNLSPCHHHHWQETQPHAEYISSLESTSHTVKCCDQQEVTSVDTTTQD